MVDGRWKMEDGKWLMVDGVGPIPYFYKLTP
jgi:hypothetical protein